VPAITARWSRFNAAEASTMTNYFLLGQRVMFSFRIKHLSKDPKSPPRVFKHLRKASEAEHPCFQEFSFQVPENKNTCHRTLPATL
jgi:hypothetical protein